MDIVTRSTTIAVGHKEFRGEVLISGLASSLSMSNGTIDSTGYGSDDAEGTDGSHESRSQSQSLLTGRAGYCLCETRASRFEICATFSAI